MHGIAFFLLYSLIKLGIKNGKNTVMVSKIRGGVESVEDTFV